MESLEGLPHSVFTFGLDHPADCTAATEYIQALRKEYGDGVTIEVHTYGKGLTDAQVWEKVKKSTVRVEPSGDKHLKYNGATSAYFGK